MLSIQPFLRERIFLNDLLLVKESSEQLWSSRLEHFSLQRESVTDNARTNGALLALVYLGMDDLDQSFRSLEFAFQTREIFFGWVRNYPLFRKVREDMRFAQLLEKAGLPTG